MGANQNEDCRLCATKISPIGIRKDVSSLNKTTSLNLGTKIFSENRVGGIMICGINWGGDPDPNKDYYANIEGCSFFSDDEVNNKPNHPKNKFNNRVVEWFGLLGHPLETSKENAGAFEYSVIQTNWARGKSKSVDPAKVTKMCIEDWANFEYHLERFRPKLIIFFSVQLLDILNSDACKQKACKLLGHKFAPEFLNHKVLPVAERKNSRRIAVQQFRDADIIALPHPTGSRGSKDYVAKFKESLFPIICKYKVSRGFKISDDCKRLQPTE